MSDDKSGRYRKGSKTDSGFSKKPSASRRRSSNRHEMETPEDLNVSASAKKLKERNFYDIEVDPSFGYRLINFIPVFAAASQDSTGRAFGIRRGKRSSNQPESFEKRK